MSLKLYEESNVRDIANAIRAKNGSTDTYAIGEMAAAVSDLSTSLGNIETVEATQIEIPSKLSAFENDSGFLTQDAIVSSYRTANAQDAIDNTKVDKVTGKGLSTNDYTAAAKAKVDAIPSSPKYTDTVYDDTSIKNRVSAVEGKFNGTGSVKFGSVTTDSLTTESQVEIYGDQPHIDFHFGNSTDDYTSRIIETTKGQVNFMATNGVLINGKKADVETVTLTINSGRLKDLSYTAKYSALLGAVFVRIYGVINADLNVGYDYDILNIGSRAPGFVAALAVKCGKTITAAAKSNGVISVRPMTENITASAGWGIYITGFWFV